MYVCEECGSVFEVPYTWTEPYGETFIGSPCCHENFEEASFCECGRLKEAHEQHCEICREEVIKEYASERTRDTA